MGFERSNLCAHGGKCLAVGTAEVTRGPTRSDGPLVVVLIYLEETGTLN